MLGIFLDSEANGLNPHTHKIVEIAFKIADLNTGEVKDQYQAVIAPNFDQWEKSDPESLKITGFTWDEVSQGKPRDTVSQEIIDCFSLWGVRRKKAVFICQNPSFDRVFFSQLVDTDTQELMKWPYHWLDLASMHWAVRMEKFKNQTGPLPWESGYSKDMIASFYQLPPEEKPHRAMNGVAHLLLCYQAVVGFPQRFNEFQKPKT